MEWHEVLVAPAKPFSEVAARTKLSEVEVLVCTLYEIISEGNPSGVKPRSLPKVIWAAGRAGILLNKIQSTWAIGKGWWGPKDKVYRQYPGIRSYLDPRPQAQPHFIRTYTNLPWRVSEVLSPELVKAFKAEFV